MQTQTHPNTQIWTDTHMGRLTEGKRDRISERKMDRFTERWTESQKEMSTNE